jgi:soluble lytic murein transglycosylase-like protein
MKNLLILFSLITTIFIYAQVTHKNPDCQPKTNAEKMYESILTHANSFDIPLHIAFNVARLETGYRGPNHESYNHKQTSKAGAVGPMQIMPQYASYFAGFPVKKKELKDSIDLNVYISMKLLAQHFKKYGNWKKVLGAYNTGKPIINDYAQQGVKKDYLKYWIPNPIEKDTIKFLTSEG